jgi:hypothetical protein
LLAGVKNGDAAAVAAKHLPKFQADVATSENQQMVRQSRELHDGFVGEIRDGIQAGYRRNVWAAAGVDENLFAFEQIIANLELVRANKTGVAAMETKAGALVDLLLLAAAKAENDFVFLSNNLGEIHANVRSVDTPPRGVSRVVSDLRAMDHRFGGRATNVDARATQVLFLDKRYIPSQIGEPMSERVASLTGADDDRVVFHGDPPLRKRAKTIHRMPQEYMKIEQVSHDEDLRDAKLRRPPNVTESA